MLRPFVAYLRVYEPLSAFRETPADQLRKAIEAVQLTRATVGEREQRLWLKSQTSAPARLLPAELPDGRAVPGTGTDFLVLDPADVPGEVGPGPLICPLEVRARSAAALVSFLGEAPPALRATVLEAGGVSAEAVRSRASAALSELNRAAVHVLSTTWTVPLPWFALVDPAQRRLHLGTGRDDPDRELSWRVAMPDALARAAEARELIENTLGDSGPTRILAETEQWLANFDPASAVELDYGGLVQLIDDPVLESDASAEEVHAILEALRAGDVEQIAELFSALREYWSELAAMEHAN
ncbi:hypothetical protein FNH05_05660 [Amycolatopsis rhizosphaerae]|uniref:DUF8083 domain-containing protein n=1 Tax=Amycolatopsis rhizosphaerae TaxID=2053003 RepID=A0A558DDZ9_9PSEU|nr:hypothetical protein [Amycolatopsis rhizosphaerae]TVT59259.1 hypothetical protein FNH05_05660 [Amycolatopsis rhizosphaerae]